MLGGGPAGLSTALHLCRIVPELPLRILDLETARYPRHKMCAGADGIFGEGISVALGYGRLGADAVRDAIARDDYTFRDYRAHVLSSPLGRALTARSAITRIIYRLHWPWFQALIWRILKPVVAGVSFIFVLNWARRMR